MSKLILAFLVIITIGCKAQNITLKEMKSNELNQFIGNIREYKQFQLKENIVKTIIASSSLDNNINSESDEVSDNIYISNCENGELLVCNLYFVENLINIKVENITEDDSNIIVQISSGNFKQRIFSIIEILKK